MLTVNVSISGNHLISPTLDAFLKIKKYFWFLSPFSNFMFVYFFIITNKVIIHMKLTLYYLPLVSIHLLLELSLRDTPRPLQCLVLRSELCRQSQLLQFLDYTIRVKLHNWSGHWYYDWISLKDLVLIRLHKCTLLITLL